MFVQNSTSLLKIFVRHVFVLISYFQQHILVIGGWTISSKIKEPGGGNALENGPSQTHSEFQFIIANNLYVYFAEISLQI